MPNYQNCNKVTYKPAGASTATVLIDLTADTVAANKMLSGTTAHDKSGAVVTGNISSKAAATYTPTTSDQTIVSGQYLSGAQTVKGDANLIAENIKKDVTIFGVTGTHEGGGTPTPPATPTDAVIFYSLNPLSLMVKNQTKNWDGTLYYSTDYSNWATWDGTTTLSAVHSNGYYKLYLRGTGNTKITGNNTNYKWVIIGDGIKCCGNLNNLLSYSGTPTLAQYAFAYLFSGAGNVGFDVTLPATTVPSYAYYNMFSGCISLTTAPALPATTLADYCYGYMFNGCISLTTAPALSATTLANYCYSSMFNGCTSLTTAPALSATTLANYCYSSMFNGCISLTTAPALPATTLADRCYYNMFNGCKNIKISSSKTGIYQTSYRIPTSGTGSAGTNSLNNMFYGTGGTFTGTPTINTTYYTSNTVV